MQTRSYNSNRKYQLLQQLIEENFLLISFIDRFKKEHILFTSDRTLILFSIRNIRSVKHISEFECHFLLTNINVQKIFDDIFERRCISKTKLASTFLRGIARIKKDRYECRLHFFNIIS